MCDGGCYGGSDCPVLSKHLRIHFLSRVLDVSLAGASDRVISSSSEKISSGNLVGKTPNFFCQKIKPETIRPTNWSPAFSRTRYVFKTPPSFHPARR